MQKYTCMLESILYTSVSIFSPKNDKQRPSLGYYRDNLGMRPLSTDVAIFEPTCATCTVGTYMPVASIL